MDRDIAMNFSNLNELPPLQLDPLRHEHRRYYSKADVNKKSRGMYIDGGVEGIDATLNYTVEERESRYHHLHHKLNLSGLGYDEWVEYRALCVTKNMR